MSREMQGRKWKMLGVLCCCFERLKFVGRTRPGGPESVGDMPRQQPGDGLIAARVLSDSSFFLVSRRSCAQHPRPHLPPIVFSLISSSSSPLDCCAFL